MIRSSTKICYLTFGRLHDRNEELSLANVANLIQTNKQAIYYIFYLQGGLCGVLRRTLQHDSAHDTNEDYRSDTVCKVSQCAPELQPNHPFDIRPTSQGKGQIKVNRTPRQAMYIDAPYLFIPFHPSISCQMFMQHFSGQASYLGSRWHTRLSQPRPHLLNWHGIRHLAALERWDPCFFFRKIIQFLLGFPW